MGEKGCPVILPTWRLYSRHWGSFTCRKSTTWDRRLYFPSEGRRDEDFFALKYPTASAGFEPANLDSNFNVLKCPLHKLAGRLGCVVEVCATHTVWSRRCSLLCCMLQIVCYCSGLWGFSDSLLYCNLGWGHGSRKIKRRNGFQLALLFEARSWCWRFCCRMRRGTA